MGASMPTLSGKLKTCASCGTEFQPTKAFQKACGIPCSIAIGRIKDEKKRQRQQRAEKRAGRERLMTRRDFVRRVQVVFNRYIRLRDKNQPCICCGRFTNDDNLITGSRWDAGHYRSVGSAPHLRFHEDNVHKQAVRCNQWAGGRAVDYRIGLIQRIGLARVEALEADQTPRKYTIDELKAMEQHYKAKVKELEKQPS